MKFTVPRSDLKHALDAVRPAVGSPGGHPVVQGVRFDVADGVASVHATDLSVRASVPLAVDGSDGTVIVPHRTLAAVVGKFRGDVVTVVASGGELEVAAGKAEKATLRTLPTEEWPKWPKMARPTVVEVSDADWQAFGRVVHAACTDPQKPAVLSAVHVGDGWVEAIDSYRAARHPVGLDLDLLIPAAMLTSIRKLNPEGGATLTVDGHHFAFALSDGSRWGSAQIAGQFPDVARLFPDEFERSITVDRADLLAAVDLVDAVNDGAATTVRLSHEGGVLTVSAAGDVGAAESVLAAEIEGDGVVVLSVAYLSSLLNACTEAKVVLRGNDGLKPWRVDDGDLAQIVMPVKVPGVSR